MIKKLFLGFFLIVALLSMASATLFNITTISPSNNSVVTSIPISLIGNGTSSNGDGEMIMTLQFFVFFNNTNILANISNLSFAPSQQFAQGSVSISVPFAGNYSWLVKAYDENNQNLNSSRAFFIYLPSSSSPASLQSSCVSTRDQFVNNIPLVGLLLGLVIIAGIITLVSNIMIGNMDVESIVYQLLGVATIGIIFVVTIVAISGIGGC